MESEVTSMRSVAFDSCAIALVTNAPKRAAMRTRSLKGAKLSQNQPTGYSDYRVKAMAEKQYFGIGELAKESGVKIVTIRYYEKIDLMPFPVRTNGNYRSYGDDARQRLQFIRRCRDLGFTLGQVRDLLRLSSQKTKACEEVKRIAVQHREAVEKKLEDLRRLSRELRRISDCCLGKGVIADCQIIETLSSSDRIAKRRNRRTNA
jgi:DNA-binding transcriptional MerR regulator